MTPSLSESPFCPRSRQNGVGVRRDELGRPRVPLPAQRGEPLVADAGDLDVARGPGRYGEHDGLRGELLARRRGDRAPRGGDVDARDRCAQADVEPVGQPLGHGGRPLGDLEVLPLLHVVGADAATHRDLARVGEHALPLDGPVGEAQVHQLQRPQHRRGGARVAQEVAHAELVEPMQVGTGERVVGVDARDHLLDALLHHLVRREVELVEPRRRLPDVDGLGHLTGDLAGLHDVRRDEGQPELRDQAEVAGVGMADDLAAELHAASVGQLHLLDPPAHPPPGLEHHDVGAPEREVAGGAQPGQPGADHDHVVPGPRHRRTTVCSGSQPSSMREPADQRSSALIRGRFCSSTVRVTPGATSTRYWVVAPW